jgi:hypothetical protein
MATVQYETKVSTYDTVVYDGTNSAEIVTLLGAHGTVVEQGLMITDAGTGSTYAVPVGNVVMIETTSFATAHVTPAVLAEQYEEVE